MSLADLLPAAGVAVGLIAAIAGIVAAVYALKAYNSSERAGSAADRRYALEVEPRVQLQFPVRWSNIDGSISATISNAGGAAKAYVVLLNESNGLHQVRGSLPAHASIEVRFQHLAANIVASIAYDTTAVAVAQDVEGRWWDCVSQTLVTDWQAWVATHQALFDAGALEQTGLPLIVR